MKIKEVFKKHTALILPYLVFLTAGIVVLILYGKRGSLLYINRMNEPSLDVFFTYWTDAGAFVLIGPVILLQAFIRYRYALITAVSSILATIITQLLKREVWYDSPRPKIVFEGMPGFHFVEGIRLNSTHSFPSGHTAGAFALFVALALINKRPIYQFLFFMTAALVGYSRMYLSQHFLIDVVVGSFVGTCSAFICHFWFNNPTFSLMTVLDRSVLKDFRKKEA
jgi:membrane-associated phospholipid phosphatase